MSCKSRLKLNEGIRRLKLLRKVIISQLGKSKSDPFVLKLRFG